MNTEIEKYITKRYDRWLDYSKYHCEQAGLIGEESDVLNEVLLSLVQKDEAYLLDLLERKKDQYCELDFYVLRMIKFNATSDTAPYRAKYKPAPADENVDWTALDIIDECEEHNDNSGYIYQRMNDLRAMIDSMYFSPHAMAIFEFKFFQDGEFKEWQGEESLKELYATYSAIRKIIKKKYNGELIF